MGLLLVLNAAEARVQCVIAEEGRILCSQDWDAPSRGTELLPPLLADTLVRLERAPKDVERIACVTGPGSFTGIRLVLTLTAAMRRVHNLPCAGLNFMQTLAASVPCAPGTLLRVLTAARRDKVHAQDFIMGTDGYPLPAPATPEPQLLPFASVVSDLADCAPVFIGSGVSRCDVPLTAVAYPNLLAPTPEALLLLTSHATWEHKDLDPLYVRPCDALDNLNHIATRRGQAPEEAHAELDRLLRLAPLH